MIFVAGAPRSGTSLTTGILDACGAWVGPSFATRHNPKGFFENRQIKAQVLKPLLAHAGIKTDGTPPFPPTLPAKPPFDVRSRLLGLVGGQPWAFKDPKTLLVWRYFVQAFPEAKWVVTLRDAHDTARSITGYYGNRIKDPKAFIHAHYERAVELLAAHHPKVRFIAPHTIIEGDDRHYQALVEWLGLTWNAQAVNAFTDRSLWHG